ncbi:ATP-binding protein [Nannocystaceae bacterium ST9]
MSSPAPVDVGDALDELVNQFADPMSFFRELIQNALDAGSDEVEIEFEFEPSASDPESGAMVVIVTDFGCGMDREIIDKQLTRLFSSSKDGDMTKIGKFGIGFVSVFAVAPDAVCVDTGRAGERWRVLFGADRSFKRLKLDEPIEGTTVRLIKTITRVDYEAFVNRAREVVGYWCRHARGEIRFRGEVISEPFGLDAPLVVSYRDEFSEIFLGHRGGATLHGFYNGGLTLIEGDHQHGSSIPEFHGMAFKVSSRYLEHTLSRDDVIKEEHYGKVVKRIRELVVGKLRDEVFARLDRALRAAPGSPEILRDDELGFLYEAAAWHLGHAQGELGRELRKLAAARSVGGRLWTWAELGKSLAPDAVLRFAARPSPLSAALEAKGEVVLAPLGSIGEGGVLDHGQGPNHHLIGAIDRATGGGHVATWIATHHVLPLEPRADERARWAGFADALARLLDDAGYKVASVRFGRFAESGSKLDGRIGISQREFGEATPVDEAGLLGKGLLDRRRVLVVDADHPSVGTALALASAEPELAAYQLAKTFLLIRGAIDQQDDTKLCQAAMRQREERCRRPPS